jgi:hypothetical protein
MSVKGKLAQWIETEVIAEAVLEELKAHGIKPTLGNGKAIWLDVLQNELPHAISSSVKAKSHLL